MTKKNYSKNNYCQCGELICNTSKRCNICAHQGKNNNNFKDGRSFVGKHYCIICKVNEISYDNWLYGKKRCTKCYSKSRKGKLIKHKSNCQCGCCKVIRGETKGKNNPGFIDGRTLKKYYCIDCGKEISYTAKRCISCEIKRRNKVGIINNKGRKRPDVKEYMKNNNPSKRLEVKQKISLANGGTGIPYENNDYSQEFNRKLREKIRKRDNYECQNCGMTEEEHLIVVGRVLEIHHIDYNKKNCEENNLITLCRWCNGRANYNRNYWKEYYINKIKIILNR